MGQLIAIVRCQTAAVHLHPTGKLLVWSGVLRDNEHIICQQCRSRGPGTSLPVW